MIDDRRKARAANAAEIRNRERAAFHLRGCQFAVARFFRKLCHLRCQLDDVFLVDIANYRHKQSAIGVDCDPNVDVPLVNNFFFPHINRCIELRKDF